MFRIVILVAFCFSNIVMGQNRKELNSLKIELETMFMEDQAFRKIYNEAELKLGAGSKEMDYFWRVVEKEDRLREQRVKSILNKYGWLGVSQIGRLANTTLWTVIQHGSIASKKKYAPLMKSSVLKGESQAIHYARLMDRMSINLDSLQIYGSRIEIDEMTNKPKLYPLKDPEYVNKRRHEIGLQPIENYLKSRDIDFNVKQKN